jgi:hypothetical protein
MFSQPSDNPAWTIGEVLYHMSIAPRFLVVDARMIANQPWLYRLVMVLMPKRLFDWLNARLTRYGARNLSRQFLADEYDKANTATLRALETIAEEDFAKSLQYPDFDPLLTGEVTLEYLFGYVKRHFDSHKEQIQSALQRQKEMERQAIRQNSQ